MLAQIFNRETIKEAKVKLHLWVENPKLKWFRGEKIRLFLISCLVLYSCYGATAQSLIYKNSVDDSKHIVLDLHSNDSSFYQYCFNKSSEHYWSTEIDTLFLYLKFKIKGRELHYKSLLDTSNRVDLFFSYFNKKETTISYYKKEFIFDSIPEYIADYPNDKCVYGTSLMENPFDTSYDSNEVIYIALYSFSNHPNHDCIIGFVPSLGIVSFGYTVVMLNKPFPISVIYNITNESKKILESMQTK